MVFKQSVLKEEKIKFLIFLITMLFCPVILIIIGAISQENLKLLLMFLFIFYTPILFLICILSLKNLEWFNIYEDRIEARCLFGIKNIVYYKNILFIEEVKINLTSRDMEKQFYIFNDGRINNNSFLGINSCYNKKKNNFRIYKSTTLENFILKNLSEKLKKQ